MAYFLVAFGPSVFFLVEVALLGVVLLIPIFFNKGFTYYIHYKEKITEFVFVCLLLLPKAKILSNGFGFFPGMTARPLNSFLTGVFCISSSFFGVTSSGPDSSSLISSSLFSGSLSLNGVSSFKATSSGYESF